MKRLGTLVHPLILPNLGNRMHPLPYVNLITLITYLFFLVLFACLACLRASLSSPTLVGMVYKKSSQQKPWFYIILSKKSNFLPEREGNQVILKTYQATFV